MAIASLARIAGQMLIGDLVKIYTRPTQIVNQIIGTGFGYNRQTMFRDVNKALGWENYRATVAKAITPRVGFRDTIPSYDLSEGERYRTYGTSVWIDEVSGFEIRKKSSFYSDVLWENDEDMEEDFGDMFGENDERYKGQTFLAFEIDGIEHNAEMPDLRLQRIR